MNKSYAILAVFLALLLCLPGAANAQSPKSSPEYNAFYTPSPDHDDNGDGIIDEQDEVAFDGYLPLTLPNLAKAYWAVGALDLDNDDAIDNYLLITACDVYAKYFSDDFEWAKIRQATRDYIPHHLAEMPTKFSAMLRIRLGKYDISKKQYEVVEESQQNSVQKIEIVSNSETQVCNFSGEIAQYPKNIVVILNRPFSLSYVPVDPGIAELYNIEQRLLNRKVKLNYNRNIYLRDAYLRIKIKLVRYKETIYLGKSRAVIYADLDGWDVFADQELTKPLYTYKVDVKKPKQKVRLNSPYNILSKKPVSEIQSKSSDVSSEGVAN